MMATATQSVTLPYVQEKETGESLEWADLASLDLSKFDQSGGKQELAKALTRAIEEVGEHLISLALHSLCDKLPFSSDSATNV